MGTISKRVLVAMVILFAGACANTESGAAEALKSEPCEIGEALDADGYCAPLAAAAASHVLFNGNPASAGAVSGRGALAAKR